MLMGPRSFERVMDRAKAGALPRERCTILRLRPPKQTPPNGRWPPLADRLGLSSIARIRMLSRQARQYLRQRQWRARQPSRVSVYTRTIQLQFQGPHTTTAGATMAP